MAIPFMSLKTIQIITRKFSFLAFKINKQTTELITEIESLEEEVANREQQVLSLYRNVFEHCVSRTPCEQNSSVASPAHPKHESRKHPSVISSYFLPLESSLSDPCKLQFQQMTRGKELPRLIMLICPQEEMTQVFQRLIQAQLRQ